MCWLFFNLLLLAPLSPFFNPTPGYGDHIPGALRLPPLLLTCLLLPVLRTHISETVISGSTKSESRTNGELRGAGSRSSIQRQRKQGCGACGSLPRSICFGSEEQTCFPVPHSQSTRFIESGSHVPCWAMQRKSVWGCHNFCSSLKPRNLGEDRVESSWAMRLRGSRKCSNWSPKLRAPSFNLQGKLSKKRRRWKHYGEGTREGVDAKDHYRVLGLRRQATAPAIKTAFRQLARQYHPDVNKDVDADDKFKSIRRAYEVLSDEASRRLYDGTLQDQTNSSRRKQVYQRREARQRRDTRTRPGYNRPQYRRATYETIEWDYSNFSYRNNQTNPESGCHGSGTAAFKPNWTNSAAGNRSSKSSNQRICTRRFGN